MIRAAPLRLRSSALAALLASLALASLALAGGAAAQAPTLDHDVVAAYPHDPGAFTQGLVYRDGHLLESTGLYPSTIRRVRLEDGAVLQRRDLALSFFGEGLVDVGDRVITLTWRNHLGFVWRLDDFEPVSAFTYPGEGWGLTYDGARLIMSDGTAQLRFLDPDTFQETGRVTVTDAGAPIDQLNELEWVDGQVLANIWMEDRIARIDPQTGAVTGWIDLSALWPASERTPDADVLNGIAWDAEGERLFVTGKNWPMLYEIRLLE